MREIERTRAVTANILPHLRDRLLGGLPAAEAKRLRRQFKRAVAEGADLSEVVRRYMIALLTDPNRGAVTFAGGNPEVERVIHSVAGLYGRVLSGDRPTAAEWAEAAKAAEAAAWAAAEASWAAAAAASWAAARTAEAAEAAEAAAEASAWTAEAAAVSAWTAEAPAWTVAAVAEDAARRDHFRWQVEVLLCLLSEAPVPSQGA